VGKGPLSGLSRWGGWGSCCGRSRNRGTRHFYEANAARVKAEGVGLTIDTFPPVSAALSACRY